MHGAGFMQYCIPVIWNDMTWGYQLLGTSIQLHTSTSAVEPRDYQRTRLRCTYTTDHCAILEAQHISCIGITGREGPSWETIPKIELVGPS
jgi:hypothetical protein